LVQTSRGETQDALWRFAKAWPWIVVAYFLGNWAVRVFLLPTLTQDESEQFLFSQALRFGYDEQPPLYTWVVSLLFALFGPSIAVLAAFKALLLSSAFLFAYASGRKLAGPVAGMMASASLFLVPQIAWEMQRDLAHTVLVFAATAATVHFLVAIHLDGRRGAYLGLGLALAVGFLAKQSFFLTAVPLLLALVFVKDVWGRLNRRWFFYALALAVLVAGPYYVWQLLNLETTLKDTAKFGLSRPGDDALTQRLRGMGAVAEGIVSTLAIPFAIWLVATLGFRGPRDWSAIARLLLIGTAISLAVILLGVLASGATSLRTRYFVLFDYPLLLLAPLVLLACVKHRLLSWLLPSVALTAALVVTVGLAIGFRYGPAFDIPNRLQTPFAGFVERVETGGCRPQAVFAARNYDGGNLRLLLPDVAVSSPSFRADAAGSDGERVLLVWAADSPEEEKTAVALAEAAGHALPPPEVETVTLPLLFSTPEQGLTHSFALRCHGHDPKPIL